ncbi:MAG: beta-galactosidase [Planctomycetota bacterium]
MNTDQHHSWRPALALVVALVIPSVALAQEPSEIPHQSPETYLETDAETKPLVVFDEDYVPNVGANTVATLVQGDAAGRGLRLDVAAAPGRFPGVVIEAPEGRWDLSAWQFINVDIENVGDTRIRLGLRADNPGADDDESLRTFTLDEVVPGETKTITLRLYATQWALDPPMSLVGMRVTPGEAAIDARDVVKLILFSVGPKQDESFVLRNVRAEGKVQMVDSSQFLPFVDRYGQFVHADWLGKAMTDDDLVAQRESEEAELAAMPGPDNFNRFGGWKDGPKLEATGHFRVAKHDGKWWLVDPDGRLFFSTGPDCVDVRFGGETGIEHREAYFAWIPDEDDPFFKHSNVNAGWAPHGFYKERLPYRMFDFHNANLERKYGEGWREAFGDIAHRRIRSWGMNTIAAWGDPIIYRQQKTAYATHVWVSGATPIAGSTGYWGQFPDVFDPEYRQIVRSAIARYEQEQTDPWNIGYFVDNEKAWGNTTDLAVATLTSPAEQAAKVVFVDDLKANYDDIEALNAAWGTDYASWDDLLQRTEAPPSLELARADLERFYELLCDTYFRTIKEEISAVAPDKLYLGVRFAWRNDIAVRASAKHCDVVSYNIYRYSIEDLRLPDGIDRPIIIGEFGFGAEDAGGFASSNTKAVDQAQRGEFYQAYIRSALNHPQVVGAHWFQYVDQSLAGRPDQENFNAGMVTVTDYPHAGLIDGIREIGCQMYEVRAGLEE